LGKSKAIRTLLGLLILTSGATTILGNDTIKEGKEIRKKVGYLPSEAHSYDEMSSRELLHIHPVFMDEKILQKLNAWQSGSNWI
jgi:ABC-2 type transport system ATP-binding protein